MSLNCCTSLVIVIVYLCIVFVLSQWETLDTVNDGPSPRRGHSMVTYTDNNNNEMIILFGGRSQYFRNCSFIDNWNWTECGDHFDEKLLDASIVLSSSSILFPNCSLNCSGNGWCHYDETISDSYCICYDDYRGYNCQIREFQEYKYDVWYLDINTLIWTEYDFVDRIDYSYVDNWPWPTERYEHTAIIKDDLMIIYGGYSPKCLDYCSDIWIWNISMTNQNNNKWIQIYFHNNSSPDNNNGIAGKRWQHIAFLSPNNSDYMYIFGGHRYGQYMNDIIQLDLNTFNWKLINNSNNFVLPPTRLGHAFSIDILNNVGYIHGGYHSTSYLTNHYNIFHINETFWLRDLWKFKINELTNSVYWENITFNGLNVTNPADEILTEYNRWYKIPFPRTDHNMQHIPNTSIILLYGGYTTGRFFNDTWRFDLNSQIWIKHESPIYINKSNDSSISLSHRSGHESIYSNSTHSIILFGGYGINNDVLGITKHNIYYNDLWILRLNRCKGYEINNECLKNNGNGICHNQFCFCNENYWGIGCQYNICPNSNCRYNNITWLEECTFCGGNGICNGINGNCECYQGYTGDDCMTLLCPNNCSDNGYCTEISKGNVECICEYGYISLNCSLYSCGNDCNERGICDEATGICHCDEVPETGRKYSHPHCERVVLKSIAFSTKKYFIYHLFVLSLLSLI